jgi:transposase InsO family protein
MFHSDQGSHYTSIEFVMALPDQAEHEPPC